MALYLHNFQDTQPKGRAAPPHDLPTEVIGSSVVSTMSRQATDMGSSDGKAWHTRSLKKRHRHGSLTAVAHPNLSN